MHDAWSPPDRLVQELVALLEEVRDAAGADLPARADALAALSAWLDEDGGRCPVPPDAGVDGDHPSARLWLLGWALHERPQACAPLADALVALLAHARADGFFARAGIASEGRLLSELGDRLVRKLLPVAGTTEDLGLLLADVLSSRAFLKDAPTPIVLRIADLLARSAPALLEVHAKIFEAVADAIVTVGLRLAQLGTMDDLRERAAPAPLAMSPFLTLGRLATRLAGASRDHDAHELEALRATIPACLHVVQHVRATLEHGSVSADLVYRLDVADRLLGRLELLCGLLDASAGSGERLLDAVRQLLVAQEEQATLRGLVRSSSRLLARRIVETSAATGEHYIAHSAQEYRRMWLSAGGGGVLMAFVAPLKFLLAALALPMFFAGLTAGVNYAAAFVLMQIFGLTLATKQPSMTAAALAGAMGADVGPAGRQRVVALIARTTSTQLAAILGNLGALIPVSVVLHHGIVAATGVPFFEPEQTERVLRSHSLVDSASVLYAALTGVWLWLSSLGAGWCDNWIRYRQLPDALRAHRRLRRVFGRARLEAAADLIDRAAGPFFGNVLIGMLLGLTPAFAGFFGAPVEIRHITIATASVVMAALSAAPAALDAAMVGWAVAGLVGIAVMNFVVSFALALVVALRARDVDGAVIRALVVDVCRSLLREPGRFVAPVRASVESAGPEGVPAAVPPTARATSASGSGDQARAHKDAALSVDK